MLYRGTVRWIVIASIGILVAVRATWGSWSTPGSEPQANGQAGAFQSAQMTDSAASAEAPTDDRARQERWLIFGFADGPVYEEVAVREHAPEFLHWIGDSKDARHLDAFSHIGFDEPEPGDPRNWVGDDNWEHADRFRERIAGTIYGGVVAITRNQMYIVYYYFHPRDYVDRWWERATHVLGAPFGRAMYHENDLEGGMLVVDRRQGSVIHIVALHHNDFDQRHLCESGSEDCWNREELEDSVVWVEAAGHGAHLVAVRDIEDLDWNRDQFTRYSIAAKGKPGTTVMKAPVVPAKELTRRHWNEIEGARYRLRALWPLFANMYTENGQDVDTNGRLYAKPAGGGRRVRRAGERRRWGGRRELTFRGFGASEIGMYRALRGRVGGKDKAHWPWGQDLDRHRFLDPAMAVLAYEDTGRVRHAHDAIACEYIYNPYLDWVLGRRVKTDVRNVERFSRTRGSWIQRSGRLCAENRE